MNLIRFYCFGLASFISLLACSNNNKVEQAKIVAKVGDYSLSIDEAVARLPKAKLKQDSANATRQEIQRWIDERVMLLESDRLNLAEDEITAKKLERMRSDVLIESLEQTIRNSSSVNISDEEILAFYQANPALFLLQEEHVNIEWFYHDNLSIVNSVRDQVMNGKPLETLIQSLADSELKNQNLQSYKQLISRTVFNDLAPIRFKRRALSVGDISDIYNYQGKNAFLKVTGLQSKGTISDFESVKLRIKDWLLAEKHKKNLLAYRRSLYLKAQSNNQIELLIN